MEGLADPLFPFYLLIFFYSPLLCRSDYKFATLILFFLTSYSVHHFLLLYHLETFDFNSLNVALLSLNENHDSITYIQQRRQYCCFVLSCLAVFYTVRSGSLFHKYIQSYLFRFHNACSIYKFGYAYGVMKLTFKYKKRQNRIIKLYKTTAVPTLFYVRESWFLIGDRNATFRL